MIDMTNQKLSFDRKPLPIKQWAVWFMTPFGLIDSIAEAIEKCEANDMLPDRNIIPVPVALDEAGRYEIVSRS